MFNKSFFRSRVARRVFLLFIISSLIPILILAALSLRQVNQLTTEQVTSRLKQDAKFYGLSIYDRLLIIEEELSIYASVVNSNQGNLIIQDAEQQHITGLMLHSNGEITSQFFGSSLSPRG